MNKVTQEIQRLDNEYVLKSAQSELENYYIEMVTISPLILHSDEHYIEKRSGIQIDVSHDIRRAVFPGERAIIQATCLDIAIPYEGESKLWRIRPSSYSISGYPEIEVHENSISFSVNFPDDDADPEKLKSQIARDIKSLVDAVENLRRDVENHNSSASHVIRDAIQRKKQQAQSAVGVISNLGIPLKRHEKPLTYTVPKRRRKSPRSRPKAGKEPFKPEPVLDETEYQYILDVMRSMSLVIERNPAAFASLNE